jgi:hypothetical protein
MKVARISFLAVLLSTGAFGFGPSARAANSTSAESSAAAATEETTPTPSPWGWLQMPKVTMPKITMPKMPADPLAPVKTSAKKVSDGTKKAWEGTKEIFTLGGGGTTQTAARPSGSSKAQPSFWKRLFGGEQKKEPEGPQTVAEWMAQPRIDH